MEKNDTANAFALSVTDVFTANVRYLFRDRQEEVTLKMVPAMLSERIDERCQGHPRAREFAFFHMT